MSDFGADELSDFDLNNPDDVKEEPIPFDDEEDDASGETSISHAPLTLGGEPAKPMKRSVTSQPKPVTARPAPRPVAKQQAIVSSEKISGMKTFFTKMHAGAIVFLDDQVTNWIKSNPGITIKRTNTATGMIVGKKTEPSLIITIWY